MVAIYSPNLRLTEQGTGDNPATWGTVLNQQVISLVDQAISGVGNINVTGVGNINIATTTQNGAVDQARNAVLNLTGTLGANIQLIVPAVQKVYLIDGSWTNSGGPWTVTVIPVGGTQGVSLTTGSTIMCYTNGTSITLQGTTGNLLASNNLSDVSNAAIAVTNLGLTIGTNVEAWSANLDQLALGAGNATINATTLGFTTAVTTTIGVGANNLIQLDALARLPAVDGRALTNLLLGNPTIPQVTNTSSGKIIFGAITTQWGINTQGISSTSNTFGTAFSAPPYYLQCQIIGGSGSGTLIAPSQASITATGFNAVSGSTNNYYWFAIGPT